MKKLTREQERLIEEFFTRLDRDAFQKELESRKERRKSLPLNKLEKGKLKDMFESDFGNLISNLWASEIWGNKDYRVKKIIKDNGMDKIRNQFEAILYGTDPFETRFDDFKIKGVGGATLTEILCLYKPAEWGIWNRRVRSALKKLKFDDLPLGEHQISGRKYKEVNEALKAIGQKLKGLGLGDVDLLVVDYFLYEVQRAETEGGEPEEVVEFDHDEIKDCIKDIYMVRLNGCASNKRG